MDIDVSKLSDNDIRKLTELLTKERASRAMEDVHKYDVHFGREQSEKWHKFFESELKRKGINPDDTSYRSHPYYWIKPAMKEICDALTGNYNEKVINRIGSESKTIYRVNASSFLENPRDYMNIFASLAEVIDDYIDSKER